MNKPFASTYKQVVKNMTYVTKLIETVFNDEAASDGMSDAYYDEALSSFKVLGISVDTEHLNDEELHPSDYTHDVTWRLKSSYVLGLGEYPLTGSKMILITTRADGSNPYQLAYSTTHGACYFRAANIVEDYWENWESAERNPIVRGSEFREKFVQLPGEYWVQPRDARDVHDYQISTWEEYNNKSFNLFGALTVYDDPTDWDTRGQAVVKIKTTYHGTIDIMATAYTSEGQTVLSSEKVAVDDFSDPIILPFPKENLDTKIGYCKVFFFEHDGFVPALPAMTLESHPNGSAIWYKTTNHRYIKVYPETIAEVIHDPGGEDVVVQIEDIHNDITELQEDKIDKAGGTMEGTIDMGGNAITGLAAPVNDSDATTKEYVDEAIASNGGIVIVDYDSDATEAYEKIEEGYQLGKAIYVRYKGNASVSSYVPYYLTLVDGPSVGLLGNKYYKFRAIHGGYEYIATLTKSSRSCSWAFETIEYLQTSGGAMSNDLNMDGHTISNLAAPTNAADATTKEYVDDRYVTAGKKSGTTIGNRSTAEGEDVESSGTRCHAEGYKTIAQGNNAHAEGNETKAAAHLVSHAHAEGYKTIAINGGHVEGEGSCAANVCHAEGGTTISYGMYTHAEGSGGSSSLTVPLMRVTGPISAGSKTYTVTDGKEVFSQLPIAGSKTDAVFKVWYKNVEYRVTGWGGSTTSNTITLDNALDNGAEVTDVQLYLIGRAVGTASHTEGGATAALGAYGHAEGQQTRANGKASHADGTGTYANHRSQHVFGEYNDSDPSVENSDSRGDYIEIVGKGTSHTERSNARTLDWDGNETLAGRLTVGNGDAETGAPSDDADVTTKKYVDDGLAGVVKDVSYDSTNKKFTKTIGSTTTDVVTASTLKSAMDLNNVENKSSETIRSEITSTNVSNALGFTPLNTFIEWGTTAPSDTRKLWIDTTAVTGGLKYHNGSGWVHVPVAYA